MSFFLINAGPFLLYGSTIIFVFQGIFSRYKLIRRDEITENDKYYDRYYQLYYRIAQLEEKLELLQEQRGVIFVHE
jgi:hypothetical protein